MKNFLPVLLKDGYKAGHADQYPKGTTLIYSNMTPRSSRVEGVDYVIPVLFQYLVKEYLIRQFEENFFYMRRDAVVSSYKRRMDNYLGKDAIDPTRIGELHELGYLPLHVKAVPEGTKVPLRIPFLTIRNTEDKFYWLTNMLETLISCTLWGPITSATTAFGYLQSFKKWARETGAPEDFAHWQAHDFSMRGLFSLEAAITSGAAHLLVGNYGSDTIPAIDFLEEYYGADADKELVAGSVPATEHSVMCMGTKDGELETIKRLITEVYPKGIVSIVCDTWDFWKVVTEILPALKKEILARDGKVVIRPDSGDPADIICGDMGAPDYTAPRRGAIETFWNNFGGTTNEKGYKQLDPHIGLIYGDSITPARRENILSRLAAKGFASSNVVLGVGSYTYQYNTRDTFGQAIKATYGEIEGVGRAIYKDPKTDDGTKKSATGLLRVRETESGLVCDEDVTWNQEAEGVLQTIFKDGSADNIQTLSQIRARVAGYL